ncbi:MAG: 3'(2'),5'-bisphosphate nucleotidase CysQ [Rhizobiales bacterium]|nr:3'(2'),5'-bisphosphate nucleotidase CysQ [Hyphomicrobiales bacterium]
MTLPRLPFLPELAAQLEAIALEAGARAMQDYRPDGDTTAEIIWKADQSPVTSADLALDRLIAERVAELNVAHRDIPSVRFHSEERPATWTGERGGLVVVLDPIDGTRAFMKGRDDWCVALGLTFEGRPVAGILYVPARGEMFSAYHGGGARRDGKVLKARAGLADGLRVSGPRGAAEAFAADTGTPFSLAPNVAALAHRLVRPLAGDFDIALSRSGGRDWDLVAADCILQEAGATLVTDRGERPDYRLAGGFHPGLRAGSTALLETLMPSHLTPDAGAAKRGL